MSKRGTESAIKINNAKSMSGGSGKGIAPWINKKKNIRAAAPTKEELDALSMLRITFISNPRELEIDKLKFLVSEKIQELTKLSNDRTPHKLKLDKKGREDLVRMINITQNRLIDYIKSNYKNN